MTTGARNGGTSSAVALAVWVKTPGHAPAKTRLAQSIGQPAANVFYGLAVDAVRESVACAAERAPGLLAPYWAVAESDPAALAHWTACPHRFATVAQGPGGLGERLARVYDRLSAAHRGVLFIGADAPQLEPATLLAAARSLAAPVDGPDFVLGPADDGGFYLFGGRTPVPHDVWTSVQYSATTTMAELSPGLARCGRVQTIAPAFDVDTVVELRRLRDLLAARHDLGDAQRALGRWLETASDGW